MFGCDFPVVDIYSYLTQSFCLLLNVSALEVPEEEGLLNIIRGFHFINDTSYKSEVFTSLLWVYKCEFYRNETEVTPNCSTFWAIIFACIFTILAFMSLIGNSVSAYVALAFRNTSKTIKFLVLSLSVSDLMQTAALYPIEMSFVLNNMDWKLTDTSCKVLPSLLNVSTLANSLTLSFIAIFRYVTIVHFYRRGENIFKKIVVLILSIWIFSIAFTIPIYESFEIEQVKIKFDERTRNCDRETGTPDDYGDNAIKRCVFGKDFFGFEGIHLFILPGVVYIPFVIVTIVSYASIIRFLRSRRDIGSETSGQSQKRKKKKQVVKTLMWLSALFLFGRIPATVYNMFEIEPVCGMLILRFSITTLRFLNCAVNPYLYGTLHEKFKLQLWYVNNKLKYFLKLTPCRRVLFRKTSPLQENHSECSSIQTLFYTDHMFSSHNMRHETTDLSN